MNLREILTEAAMNLDDAKSNTGEGGIEWTRQGHLFATLSVDGAAEFLLEGPVAAAAARTPDTAASSRGAGWVRFSPSTLDAHGVDRASAWLASAYRHAAVG